MEKAPDVVYSIIHNAIQLRSSAEVDRCLSRLLDSKLWFGVGPKIKDNEPLRTSFIVYDQMEEEYHD
jgi:hypothetical protein